MAGGSRPFGAGDCSAPVLSHVEGRSGVSASPLSPRTIARRRCVARPSVGAAVSRRPGSGDPPSLLLLHLLPPDGAANLMASRVDHYRRSGVCVRAGGLARRAAVRRPEVVAP